jgi:hypothetical protein
MNPLQHCVISMLMLSSPAFGCARPPEVVAVPTVPEPPKIVPAVGEVSVGESLMFRLTSATTPAVRWRTIPPDVATIDDRGVLTGVRMGIGYLTAEFGETILSQRIVVRPKATPLRQGLDGDYRGTYKIEECDRTAGAGPSTCRSMVGSIHPILLHVEQVGNEISGAITLERGFRGSFRGWRDLRGRMFVIARLNGAEPNSRIEVSKWDVRASRTGGQLEGTFESVQEGFGTFGHQVYWRVARIQTLRR